MFPKLATGTKFDLARLPPIQDAVRFHAMGSYQVQRYLEVEKKSRHGAGCAQHSGSLLRKKWLNPFLNVFHVTAKQDAAVCARKAVLNCSSMSTIFSYRLLRARSSCRYWRQKQCNFLIDWAFRWGDNKWCSRNWTHWGCNNECGRWWGNSRPF